MRGRLGVRARPPSSGLIDAICRERLGGNRTVTGVRPSDVISAAADPRPKHRRRIDRRRVAEQRMLHGSILDRIAVSEQCSAANVVTRGGAAR